MDINEKLDTIMNMVKGITLKLEEHDKKFDLIGKKFDAIDEKFDTIDKRFDAIDEKFDAIDEKFDTIDKRFDAIDEKFDAIDEKFDTIDKRFDAINEKFDTIDKRFDAIDLRIDILTGSNREEHEKMMVLITNLASSFTRFEAEYTDKYKILFDMTQDYIEHKSISALQLTSLEEKVKNNSFRISKLEKAI